MTYGLGPDTILVPPIEPNPAETVWTLGVDGAFVVPSVVSGASVLLATTLYNNGVVVGYESDAVIDASVWIGGHAPVSFTPSAAWIDSAAGTLSLIVSSVQSAAVAAGLYRMQVGVTPMGGLPRHRLRRDVQVFPSPASITPACPTSRSTTSRTITTRSRPCRITSTTRPDSRKFASSKSNLFDRRIELRNNPLPGMVLTRQNIIDPIVGQDVALPTAVPPSQAQITTSLGRGGLILEQMAVEQVRTRVIANILKRQPVNQNVTASRPR